MDKKDHSDKIDAILPSLWNDGLLTDLECRLIASIQNPDRKIGFAYEMTMSRKIPAALNLIGRFCLVPAETYKGMLSENKSHLNNECNRGTYSECNCNMNFFGTKDSNSQCESECNFDCKGEEKKNNPNSNRNPFLQSVVIECLLGYLTVKEIKNTRLVCQIWNSTSELILRKRAAIYFCPNLLRPAVFLAASKYSVLELPFSSYKFIEYNDWYEAEEDKKSWRVPEIENFFHKWGKNIKELSFLRIFLANGRHGINHDITPWFANLQNVTNLKIQIACHEIEMQANLRQTLLEISLVPLASIKTISLEECCILTNAEDEIKQIAPSNIILINISLIRDGEYVYEYSYNDFVDFSQVKNALVVNTNSYGPYLNPTVKFDMGCQVWNADQLCLLQTDVRNWKEAKGNVHYLHLIGCPFTVKNQMKIKQLYFEHSKIDLSVVPNTIEKIRLSSEKIRCRQSIQFDNLNYLYFHLYPTNSRKLAHFGNCTNLTELELISTMESNCNVIHLECIPKSVQKCRIEGLSFTFSSHKCIWELDTLILEECQADGPLLIDCRNILDKIKPKTLVLVYSGGIEVDTSDIMKFVVDNEQIENVIVGSNNKDWDLHKNVPYEGSLMSMCVGKKSNYYLFENQIGQAIKFWEFKQWTKMNDLEEDFYK